MSLIEPEAAPAGLADRVLIRVGLADHYVVRSSPVGDVAVAYNKHGISACRVIDADIDPSTDGFESWFAARFQRPLVHDDNAPRQLVDAVDRLLAGGTPKPLPAYDLRSVGPFARDVLTAAATIAPGQVRPYAWIAERIGRPKAVRAVGTALGGNPIPLLIPCHRVVRNDGKIGHYAFGPAMKQALLAHEGVDLPLMAGAPPGRAAANRRPT